MQKVISTKPIIRLKKYGRRAYHVLIDGEMWGNVCGYEERTGTEVAWTASWFTRNSCPANYGGRTENRLTRYEAVEEVKINTARYRQ